MVGIEDTSGKLITGERRYETCAVCRELINPCLLRRNYVCGKCNLVSRCNAKEGNPRCTASDAAAAADARRTNTTILYRCHFGLANYAIPIKIGELGSIILYGGQFRVKSLEPPDGDPDLIVEFDADGNKIVITEREFRKVVSSIDRWRILNGYPDHQPWREREKLITRYLESSGAPIKTVEASVGSKKYRWKVDKLEELLRGRYNLSLFEPWTEFLSPPSRDSIDRNVKDLFSWRILPETAVGDEVLKSAREALEKYRENIYHFFFNPEEVLDEYKEAIIPLSKAFSTMELLKELATLISRTANVVFYKDIYFMLKNMWDNHPMSVVEFFDDRWKLCKAILQELDTKGKEPTPPEISSHLELVADLTRNLMFFAYKLLSDDFRSVILMLRYNLQLLEDYGIEGDLRNQTECIFNNMTTTSCLFIRDLLEAKYEKLAKGRLERLVSPLYEQTYQKIMGLSRERLRERLETYQKKTKIESFEELEITDENREEIIEWKNTVLDLLKDAYDHDLILQSDVMLRFFYLVFAGRRHEDIEKELKRIDVNLRWANEAIEEQVERLSASVLEFDICQSLLQFVNKLRGFVYEERFKVLRRLATEKHTKFIMNFMEKDQMSCKYFINHGIEHVTKVLENVDHLIKFAEDNDRNETGKNICKSPVWQYYVRCSALFHDVGMFYGEDHADIYGGPDAIRRCHGAFSGKRIIEERIFDILGSELDKRIVAQICTFHHGNMDIGLLHTNIQPLAAILRIADEFDVGQNRLPVNVRARDSTHRQHINRLGAWIKRWNDETESDLITPTLGSEREAEDIEKLMEQTLEIARKAGHAEIDIWPIKIPCFEFVQRRPRYEAESFLPIDILRSCSEIRAILETDYHYQKHKCVEDVRIITIERGIEKGEAEGEAEGEARKEERRKKKYLVPLISIANLDKSIHTLIKCGYQDQPRIIAERVKNKFKKEIDEVRQYLEPLGIRFKGSRVKEAHTSTSNPHNLLFVNAPVYQGKMKFTGAPTSLLYAIAPTAHMIDNDRNYMHVNMEIWDPDCFGEDEEDELFDILDNLDPKIVGVSNTSAGHFNALRIAKIIRSVKPEAVIIFGGPHENVRCEDTIRKNRDTVDVSIGGVKEPFDMHLRWIKRAIRHKDSFCASTAYRADAEYVLKEIVKKILKSGSPRDKLAEIMQEIRNNALKGKFRVAFWDYEKNRVAVFESQNGLNVNELPNPPRHLLEDSKEYNYEIFRDKITGKIRKTAQVITTRGCIHRCIFCSSVGRSARRTVDNVINELKQLKSEGYEAIFFDDSTFADECGEKHDECPYTMEFCPKEKSAELLKKKYGALYTEGKCGYAIKLCQEMINNNFDFVWGCQTRADVVHRALLEMMKKAGCIYVYFGVESLNKDVLEKMCKDIRPEEIEKGIRLTREEGLDVGLSLVFGLEGENSTTVKETMNKVSEMLKPIPSSDSRVSCISINVATVYPGTRLEQRLRDENAEVPDFDKPPRFCEYPWNQFEDGIWNVPPCTALLGENVERDSEILAKKILKGCREQFGHSLV